jgi:hypothetical protein
MPFKNQHPLYSIWLGMRARCKDKNLKYYCNYGGRGIKVCERWQVFANFVEDMGPRPEGYSLDRINNDGNYEPNNCRWADKKQQSRNTRRTNKVVIDGKQYLIIDLADRAGMKADTILNRIKKGLPFEEIISPVRTWNTSGFSLGGPANGRNRRAKTHCLRGHEFTEATTYYTGPMKHRACRVCHAMRQRRRNTRNRDATPLIL